MTIQPASPVDSLAARLRAETHPTHERLDGRIMSLQPFAGRPNYLRFLKIQCAFHAAIEELYDDAWLASLLPDLADRCRLAEVRADVVDLGGAPVFLPVEERPAIGGAEALGWLYVAEGSNLGAAFLLKAAKEQLGLSEEFGARHLAGHPEGRGLQWRRFTAALDAVELSAEEEARAIEGARRAFEFVLSRVEAEAAAAA
ncbi:biliverdin-producing heme oxygenase [Rhizobium straminoryzae]|uniref:Biliverdin-producing heme oxygenase n=1 Tax=Rhizobium straminoryzae TaxID=1387186 RepID=A0A549TBL1_9HYPH|nr:biliverdin-producing heme oxygenase [Rhizobium straminoryzae]TRL39201.1 biliverdin-producing heme oxygenase [Rhizobium straminoryzae]